MLRRLRPVARARAAGAARAARRAPPRRSSRTGPVADGELGALDEAILDVVASAEPEVGRTRAVEILRGGRSKVVEKYSYDGLPHYGAWSHLAAPAVLERVDALLDRRHAALHRRAVPEAGGGMRVGVLASGAGTNLQAILDRVHGRDGVEVVAVGSRPAEAPRRSSAPRAPACRPATFPRVGYADRAARDAAIADFLAGARRRARRARRLHGAAHARASSPASRGRVINVHPALLPAFPGLRAIEQALDYGVKVFGVTVHFVDEGVDTGPIIAQRALELPGRDRSPPRCARRCARSSTTCCARPSRGSRAAPCAIDPAHPRRVMVER